MIRYYACKPIATGEELCIYYGSELWFEEAAGGEQVDKGGSACAERKPGADVEKSTVRSGARRKRGEEEVGSAPKFPRGSCSPADCGRGRCLEEGGEKAASAKSPEVQDERGRRSRRRSGRTIKTPA